MPALRVRRIGRPSRPFTHLHLHTEYSILDGCGKLTAFVKRAEEQRMTAVCMTEHGTMRGIYSQYTACGKHGIQPIYGIEFYMAPDMRQKGLTDEQRAMATAGVTLKSEQKKAVAEAEKTLGIRDRFHICAYAMNKDGLRNLFVLSSLAWRDGFYYRPRIDMKTLMAHAEGVIMTTGCASGIIPTLVLNEDWEVAIARLEELIAAFGDRLYAEIQPINYDEQKRVNKGIITLARHFGMPLVATNDAHYIGPEDSRNHEILLCLSTRDVLSNPNRWRFDATDLWMKSRLEMEESFHRNHPYISEDDIMSSLDNTDVIRERCKEATLEVDRFKCLLPPVAIPEEDWGDFKEWRKRKMGVDTRTDLLKAAGGLPGE